MTVNPWVWRLYVCVGVVLTALFWIGDPVTQAVIYGVLGTAVSVAMLMGRWLQRPQPAAAWWLVWAGIQTSLTGDVVLGLRTWAFPASTVLPVVENVLYLFSYVGLAAGQVVLIRSRSAGRDGGALIDAAIVTCALALPLWLVAVAPVLAQPDQSAAALVLRLAIPLADVVLLVLLLRLLTGGGTRNASLYLFLAAMCGWLAGDVINAALSDHGHVQSYWGGALYCLCYVLLGTAVLHPSMAQIAAASDRDGRRFTVRRLVLLAGMSLLAPGLLLGQQLVRGHVDAVPIGVACMVLFLLVVARMAGLIRQVERQAERLSELAAKDALTGVGNRRSWDAALDTAVAAADRSGQPLAVALLDLDHFKRYNDTYGHQAGDQLLKGAAAGWLNVLRRDDVLYRYGGEEFALLLAGATWVDARSVVDRLREATPAGQTFSAGIAHLAPAETPQELVARADLALYRAKENGRARTEYAPSSVAA